MSGNGIVILIFILIMLTFLFFISFPFIEELKNDKFCEVKGYDEAGSSYLSEPGYIKCCKNIYKEHIWVEDKCEMIPQ